MRLPNPILFVAAAVAVTAIAVLVGGGHSRLAVSMGLAEGSLSCHAGVTGLDGAHAPKTIGCASCHAGDKRATDKAVAHAGLVLIPGNLADAARTCGQAGCHHTIVPRVERTPSWRRWQA